MTGFDPEYAAEVLAWLVVWSTAGLVGRQLLARRPAPPRKPPR